MEWTEDSIREHMFTEVEVSDGDGEWLEAQLVGFMAKGQWPFISVIYGEVDYYEFMRPIGNSITVRNPDCDIDTVTIRPQGKEVLNCIYFDTTGLEPGKYVIDIESEGHCTIDPESRVLEEEADFMKDTYLPLPSWDDAPEWAKWRAVDENGECIWFHKEPYHDHEEWLRQASRHEYVTAGKGYDPTNWKDSLEERPISLADRLDKHHGVGEYAVEMTEARVRDLIEEYGTVTYHKHARGIEKEFKHLQRSKDHE